MTNLTTLATDYINRLNTQVMTAYIGTGSTPEKRSHLNALSKAAYELAGGIDIRAAGRFYYMPSRTNTNVYAVDLENDVCSCQHGTAPGAWCWHKAAARAFERAQVAAVAEHDGMDDLFSPPDDWQPIAEWTDDAPETVVEVIDADVAPEFVDSDPAFWTRIAAMIEAGDVIATEVL